MFWSSSTAEPPPPEADRTPFDEVRFAPAILATKSAIDSFLLALLSLASINPKLSAATSIVPALRPFKSVEPPAAAEATHFEPSQVKTSSLLGVSWPIFVTFPEPSNVIAAGPPASFS